ncbi:MAG: hypothetical protein JWP80_2953 [Pseudomonas sp.]|nr:hypothetical protein [Pseudomonas sp.]
MEKHWDFRLPVSAAEASNTSCLTINQTGAMVGLNNLLDLIYHEIIQEHDKQIHRITFKSGETLYIKADGHTVTVRGKYINYDSDSKFPFTTILSDPARR